MSEQTPPEGDPKKPPADDPKKDPKKPYEHLGSNDWNITITDDGKVQMEQAELNKILSTMNSQVTMHDSFVKKTMAIDKTRIIEVLSEHIADAIKKELYVKFLAQKSNQDLELLEEERKILGGEIPILDKDKETAGAPTTPPPSSHNQSDQTGLQGKHSPMGLIDKKENIYSCTCTKSHKLDEFYSH